MIINDKVSEAVDIAFRYGQTDGSHHKAWVIDQMVRTLLGEKKYKQFIKNHNEGVDGPDTYEWDEGCPP